jgi:hypothetical protein
MRERERERERKKERGRERGRERRDREILISYSCAVAHSTQ